MVNLRAGMVIAANLFLTICFLFLSHLNGTPMDERINSLTFSMFPLTGAVLLARHSRNPVGLLLTIIGLAVLGASTLFEYGALTLSEGFTWLPLGDEIVWISLILWTTILPCVVLLVLLFPDGRFQGRGWRWLGWSCVIISLPLMLASMVVGWRNRSELVKMDLGVIPPPPEVAALFRVYDVWNLILIGAIIAAMAGFIIRFRRARGIERQQLKWFVFGLSTIPISMVLEVLVEGIDSPLLQGINWTLSTLSVAAFPVILLIAITRYRLYDIDFIIRRTLLYSALTLTLAVVYFGSVVIAQALFTREFGEQSSFVLVLSTLLIAALFQPLRRRFQAVIDRRFYRSKYNAEQTLERFAARLQSEVDPDEIGVSLLGLVEENIQPERAALWLVRK